MNDYVGFCLYGPLAAWGTIAVGRERRSDAHPSKSALLGLLAAAMGVRRDEEDVHARMATSYGFAVRVDAPGALLRDYHTTQVPPEQRKVVHYTRRDELLVDELSTILSTREYRCDALYTVVAWIKTGRPAPFTLEQLADGLRQPRFVLYLGRKSCPLALPVQATLLTASNLQAVFEQIPCNNEEGFALLKRPERLQLYWETDADAGDLKLLQTITRHDSPLNRRRWQFTERGEHQGSA